MTAVILSDLKQKRFLALKIPPPAGAGAFRLEIWWSGFRTASWTSVSLGKPTAFPAATRALP